MKLKKFVIGSIKKKLRKDTRVHTESEVEEKEIEVMKKR